MKTVFAIILLIALVNSRSYTLFKQCDSKWANEKLGTSSTTTICKAGCAMTSLTMIMNTHKITVDGNTANPSTVNKWLIHNGGYVSSDELVWGAVDKRGLKFYGSFGRTQAASLFDKGYHIILNVDQGHHFVLMTGHSGTTFDVNDPGFTRSSYPETEVVGIRAYNPVAMTLLQEIFAGMN